MSVDFKPNFLVGPMLSWESQVVQYPKREGTFIEHFLGKTSLGDVDCLLFYRDGELLGILNHYGFDAPNSPIAALLTGSEYMERKGNINIFIHPDHKKEGIATALLRLAEQKFGPINFAQQSYTAEGWEFIQRYIEKRDSEFRD